MNEVKLTNEQIDAICLALHDAAIYRQGLDESLEANLETASVYESLRKSIRKVFPHTSSIKKLVLEGVELSE